MTTKVIDSCTGGSVFSGANPSAEVISVMRVPRAFVFILAILLVLSGTAWAQQAEAPDKTGDTGEKKSILDRFRGSGDPSEESDEGSGSDEEKKGGFFGGLNKLMDNKRVSSLVDSVSSKLESGKEQWNEFLESSSEANGKIEAILNYVDGKIAGRMSEFTPDQIREHADTIIPLVEEVNRRKFAEPPTVKSVGTFQMIHILARDLKPQFEHQLPGVSAPVIYLKSYLSSALYAPRLMGKYGVEDNTLYVLPTNLRAVMEEGGIDLKYEEDILKIVIGHELTHALQDQEIDLGKSILTAKSADAMNAFNATIEGHAVFMQNALAKKMGIDAAASEATTFLVAGDLDEDAWLYERIAHEDAVQMEQVYLGGERFIAHHVKKDGVEKIWQILKEPPLRSSMITQPETYAADPPPLPDYAAMLGPVVELLDLKGWVHEENYLGDFDLRATLSSINSEKRETVLREMKQAASVSIASQTDVAKSVDLAVFQLDSSENAALLVEAIEKLIEHDLAGIEENPSIRLISEKKIPYSVGDQLKGSAHRYETNTMVIGESTTTSFVLSEGNVVVHLLDQGSGLKYSQLNSLMSGVASRFQ